jgi:hypothetical protein
MTDSANNTEIKLTIVGGQPSKARRLLHPGSLPGGIAKVLRRAATDETFRQQLLEDRQGSLTSCGVDLSPSERAALNAVTSSSLQAMIAGIRV